MQAPNLLSLQQQCFVTAVRQFSGPKDEEADELVLLYAAGQLRVMPRSDQLCCLYIMVYTSMYGRFC